MSDEIKTVRAFIDAINSQNFETMENLMTPDHTFIDGGGGTDSGIDRMIPGWKKYFEMFPDFNIKPEYWLQNENMIAVFGSWTNTYCGKRGLRPENRISGLAAWKAVIQDGKIALWQIYTDYTEAVKIIEADEKQE